MKEGENNIEQPEEISLEEAREKILDLLQEANENAHNLLNRYLPDGWKIEDPVITIEESNVEDYFGGAFMVHDGGIKINLKKLWEDTPVELYADRLRLGIAHEIFHLWLKENLHGFEKIISKRFLDDQKSQQIALSLMRVTDEGLAILSSISPDNRWVQKKLEEKSFDKGRESIEMLNYRVYDIGVSSLEVEHNRIELSNGGHQHAAGIFVASQVNDSEEGRIREIISQITHNPYGLIEAYQKLCEHNLDLPRLNLDPEKYKWW